MGVSLLVAVSVLVLEAIGAYACFNAFSGQNWLYVVAIFTSVIIIGLQVFYFTKIAISWKKNNHVFMFSLYNCCAVSVLVLLIAAELFLIVYNVGVNTNNLNGAEAAIAIWVIQFGLISWPVRGENSVDRKSQEMRSSSVDQLMQ